MTLRVRGPGGEVVNFPDDTPHEVINKAMSEHFGSPTQTNQEMPEPTPAPSPQQQTDAMSVPEKFGRAATYGIVNGAEGAVNTLGKSIEGADPKKLAKLQSLISAVKERMGVSPDQYAPASQAAQDPNATLGQRLLNVPRSVVEMAGPAVVGGAIGGLPGAVATIGATEAGPTVDRVREADKTSPDQELTVGQKARVAAKVATDMGLAALGGKATLGAAEPIMATGLQGLKQAATQTGKAVGIDALAGSGATAADKALVDKELASPSDLAVGAVQGGLPGLAARAPRDFGGGLKARENILSDLNPESLNRLNERIQTHKEAGAENPLAAAKSDIQNEINFYKTENSPLLKDILEKTGHTDTTKVALDNAIDAVKENRPVPVKILDTLSNTLGGTYHGDNLLRLLSDHEALNKVNDLSQSSLSNSKLGKVLNPFGRWPTSALDLGASAVLLGGAHHIPYLGMVPPEVAAGLLGTQAAGYFGMKGIDRLTGASDINSLVNRVSKKNGGDTGSSITTPSFHELQAQAKADFLAKNLQERQAKATEAQNEFDKAKALKTNIKDFQNFKKELDRQATSDAKAKERANNQFWKEQRERLAIRTNSDVPASEYLGQDTGFNQNVPLPELVSSDTTLALKTAKLKKYLQDKRMTQLGQQANIMRNSQALAEREAVAEQARIDTLLRNVGQQNRIRIASEAHPYDEMQSDPGVFRANKALAIDRANAAAEAEAAANAPPPAPEPTYNPEHTQWGPSSDIKPNSPTAKAMAAARAMERHNNKINKQKTAERRKAEKAKSDVALAKASKTAKDAEVKATETKIEADPNIITFEHRGQKIIKSKDDVDNPKAYREKFVKFTDKRLNLLDKAKSLTKSKSAHKLLDQLAEDWTQSTNDPNQAHNHMLRISNKSEIPEVVKKYLKDNWNSVEGTWATVNKNDKE